MKALVTGSEGFVGKRLCRALELQNHTVYKHDLAVGDLTQQDALDPYPACDIVYHLAARTFVPDSWALPHDYFRVNIMGTLTALEYCRKHNAHMVLMSTYVYGEPQYLPVDEKHPLKPASPYHQSKITCEELCRFYCDQYEMDAVVLRPFNIFGQGQSKAFLLPKVMDQILNPDCEVVEVFDLTPKRDYVYVEDVVCALACCASCPSGYHTFNVGTGVSVSVEQVIQCMLRIIGSPKKYRATQEQRNGEISDCRADMLLAREQLGFIPRYSLEDGIAEWYQQELKANHC